MAEQKWISVNDWQPNNEADVLVYEYGDYAVGYYTPRAGWITYGDEVYKPTHWMPLPEPPKGEQ